MHRWSFDLNLLVSLEALLEEASVTRAAQRLGLTQSATSHALGRLRAQLGDPLLVRSGRSMVLTARAQALRAPLRQALRGLRDALDAGTDFEPGRATGQVQIMCQDYVASLLLPRFVGALQAQAPALDVGIEAPTRSVLHELEHGQVDMAIAVFFDEPAGFRQRALFRESFSCVVRRDHPLIRRRMTLKRYTEIPHVLIGTGRPGRGAADVALAKLGKQRRVAVRIDSFLAAPALIAETDFILTVPHRLAELFARQYGLKMLSPPVEIASFTYSCRWHERWQADARHQWLRKQLFDCSRALG